MSRVKGSTLLLRLAYLQKESSPQERERVLDRLTADVSEVVRRGVLASEWYPMSYFVALNRSLDNVLGNGDGSLIWRVGRFAADMGAKNLYKAFSRQGKPKLIFENAALVWRQFYDSGQLSVVDEGKCSLTLLVEEFASPAVEHCLSVGGWIERNVELSGVRDVSVVERSCRSAGATRCEFAVSWSP